MSLANADQAAYWNSASASLWAQRQERQDRLLKPANSALFAAAALRGGERVIDIGCGCGETTLIAAERVGPEGYALGLDISAPMLARARERAALAGSNAAFRLADATSDDLADTAADALISRFGVMFFADPAASFANLRRGLKRGGRLAFVCWREPKRNPWNVLPYHAIRHLVPALPKLGPEDPGPFSFAEPMRVERILKAAGFDEIEWQARDLVLDTADGGGLEAAVETAMDIGPAALALTDQPEVIRRQARECIAEALRRHQLGDNVWLEASILVVTAQWT